MVSEKFSARNPQDFGSLRELSFHEESELVDYRVFGTWEGDSHLSQMILLDESVVDSIIATHGGRSCVEVLFSHRVLPGVFFILGAHFPHKSSGEHLFQDALLELEGTTDRASSADVILFAGDWNCQQGDQRFLELCSLLHSKGFTLAYPESDTWVGALSTRRYDYFFVRIRDRGRLQYLDAGDVLRVTVNDAARQELDSDHALVSLDLLLAPKGPRLKRQRDRRPAGCRKAYVKAEGFEEAVALMLTPSLEQDVPAQWLRFNIFPVDVVLLLGP